MFFNYEYLCVLRRPKHRWIQYPTDRLMRNKTPVKTSAIKKWNQLASNSESGTVGNIMKGVFRFCCRHFSGWNGSRSRCRCHCCSRYSRCDGSRRCGRCLRSSCGLHLLPIGAFVSVFKHLVFWTLKDNSKSGFESNQLNSSLTPSVNVLFLSTIQKTGIDWLLKRRSQLCRRLNG